jgi:hypothetical protein
MEEGKQPPAIEQRVPWCPPGVTIQGWAHGMFLFAKWRRDHPDEYAEWKKKEA